MILKENETLEELSEMDYQLEEDYKEMIQAWYEKGNELEEEGCLEEAIQAWVTKLLQKI